MRFAIYALTLLLPLLVQGADGIAGTWRGESACVAIGTACTPETVVYRFASLPAKPGYFSGSADKIMNGHPINMGTLEFRYDDRQHELTCEYAQGTWRLKVEGNGIEGTLTRSDGTVFRKVILRKEG